MFDWAITILFFASLAFLFADIFLVIERDYPLNPLRWAQERRGRINRATVSRISGLEHDLGYRPCSDDECWTCERYVERLDTSAASVYTRLWDEGTIPSPPKATCPPSTIRK